mmetsp:Transcript_10941/g.22290  ORF Transcript_10941/g.22290 Transcript_10941/m.22290 type:complete len:226 (+) Transcript_10941:118-795(+)
MFALRQINNNYSDFAGTRSDFCVVGHPEFNLGKVGAELGYGHGWDNTNVKSLPKRSPAVERFRSSGGLSKHIRQVAEVPTGPRQSLKERALTRSRSSPQMAGSGTHGRGAPTGGDAFDAFVAEMGSTEKLPPCSPNRTVAGFANHTRSQPVCKHYASVQEELKDLRTRLRASPEATKGELLADDSWKYYAAHLEQAKRNEAQWRRCKLRATPNVQTLMLPATSGH